jgi:hypothetical protein
LSKGEEIPERMTKVEALLYRKHVLQKLMDHKSSYISKYMDKEEDNM